MDYRNLSDLELLARIVGPRTAERLYRGTLVRLFSLEEKHGPALEKLLVARELMRRLLVEEMHYQDTLASPEAVRDYLRLFFIGKEHECFAALFLDSQNRLIVAEELFRGTLAQTSVYPREVVKQALRHNSAGVIFAHNHPSGVAEPSRADELLTSALKQALALVDIRVLDHFVVAGTKVISFAERGLL